jgi:hypothetical protein
LHQLDLLAVHLLLFGQLSEEVVVPGMGDGQAEAHVGIERAHAIFCRLEQVKSLFQ